MREKKINLINFFSNVYDVYYGKDGRSNDFMNLLDKKEIDVSDIQV